MIGISYGIGGNSFLNSCNLFGSILTQIENEEAEASNKASMIVCGRTLGEALDGIKTAISECISYEEKKRLFNAFVKIYDLGYYGEIEALKEKIGISNSDYEWTEIRKKWWKKLMKRKPKAA